MFLVPTVSATCTGHGGGGGLRPGEGAVRRSEGLLSNHPPLQPDLQRRNRAANKKIDHFSFGTKTLKTNGEEDEVSRKAHARVDRGK